MLNASRALARTVDLKIGWNRIGIVISLLIVSIAAVTLYNLLHDIQFDNCPVDAARLAACPYLARVTVLNLSSSEMSAEQLGAFLASPYLTKLATLDLGYNRFGAAGAALLGASPLLARWREGGISIT